MTERRWLAVVAAAGIALFGLSFLDAWILQVRQIRGEGYRWAESLYGAWRGPGMPVLTLAAVAALVVAVGALLRLAGRWRTPDLLLLAGSPVALGLVLAGGWPVTHRAHTTTVDLTAWWLLPVGALLALVMLAGSLGVAGVGRGRALASAAALTAGVVALGAVGRWQLLAASEGTGRHWTEGRYTRPATGDQPTETLVLTATSYAVEGRWSGKLEWGGWTVVFDDDPACPGSRGTYHARDAGGENIRFVKVVDTCLDGERAADFEAGIWHREP